MKPSKKPWQAGYIPPPKRKPAMHPAVPEGWVRVKRNDYTHFARPGVTWWGEDVIIGRVGEPWRLWFSHQTGTIKAPDAEMKSLKALLVWYQVETAGRETQSRPPLGSLRQHAADFSALVELGKDLSKTDAQAQLDAYRKGYDLDFSYQQVCMNHHLTVN